MGHHRHKHRRRLSLWWLFIFGVAFVLIIGWAVFPKHTTRHAPLSKQQPLLPPPPHSKREAPSPPPPPPLTTKRTAEMGSCPIGWDLQGTEHCVRSSRGVNLDMIDAAADACTQPYRYACGAYLDDPRNQGENLLFYSMYQKNREIMQNIVLEHASNDPQSDVGQFYHACVDYLESPEKEDSPTLDQLMLMLDQTLVSHDDLPRAFGLLAKYDIPTPISLSFEVDPLKGSTLIPFLSQHLGVFSVPTNDLGHLATLQSVLKISFQAARRITALEQTLLGARQEPSSTALHTYASREYNHTDLVRDWHGFSESVRAKGFNVNEMLRTAWPDAYPHITRAWVNSPMYMNRFAELHRMHSVDTWREYLRFACHVALESGAYTNSERHYAYHQSYDGRWAFPWKRPQRFYMVTPSSDSTNEQQCVYATEAYLPLLLDDYYIHTALDDARLEAASRLTQSITDTFIRQLEDPHDTLFSPHLNRTLAAHKIKNMQIILGAPVHWRELLQFPERPLIRSQGFLEDVLQVRHYHGRYLEKMFAASPYKPLDADRLFDGLLSVDNAFYVHQLNSVIINAGVMQDPLFSPEHELEAQYGRLGVVLAHEISHSVDRAGTHFDWTGSIVEPAWMSADAFDADTHYIEALYSRPSYLQNINDGQRTMNENIADQYGLHIAWRALLTQKPDASFGKFRVAYSQMYCDGLDKTTERKMAQRSTHSINSVRVTAGLSTFPCL